MPSFLRRRLLQAAAAALASPLVRAQGLSSRPIRLILGQTAATTPDLIARLTAQRLQARWHQPVIVENRGGAGGAIGLDAVAKAPADGHTITVNVNSTLTLPLFFKIDFDVLESFTPITLLAQNIFVLVVHPSVPAKNFAEFTEWAKRQGEKANYGSPGNGTHHHLMMESLKLRTGLALTHVPYKGSAPAFTDLIGGQIATMFVPLGTALSLAAKLRWIGGSARERSSLAPELASLHEQGRGTQMSGFDFSAWFAAWGPAGLPAEIVGRYNATLHEIFGEPEMREALAKHGATVRLSTPQELDQLNRADFAALAKLVKDAKIKGD